MSSKRRSQRSATKRTRLAAGLAAVLAISACGMTTENPDKAASEAGSGALAASGSSSSSGVSTPGISTPSGGRAGSSSAAGSAGIMTPNIAGAPSEGVGGEPGEVMGGAPNVGGEPNASGAPTNGGAPGSNCATFEEAWRTGNCTAVIDAELVCRELCTRTRNYCDGNCQQNLDECSAGCMTEEECGICNASAKFCQLSCARPAAICHAKCVSKGIACRRLLTDYPDCAAPPAPGE